MQKPGVQQIPTSGFIPKTIISYQKPRLRRGYTTGIFQVWQAHVCISDAKRDLVQWHHARWRNCFVCLSKEDQKIISQSIFEGWVYFFGRSALAFEDFVLKTWMHSDFSFLKSIFHFFRWLNNKFALSLSRSAKILFSHKLKKNN